MSADNVIYVRGEYDGEVVAWFVWEQSASVEPDRRRSYDVLSFPTKEEHSKALETINESYYQNDDLGKDC